MSKQSIACSNDKSGCKKPTDCCFTTPHTDEPCCKIIWQCPVTGKDVHCIRKE